MFSDPALRNETKFQRRQPHLRQSPVLRAEEIMTTTAAPTDVLSENVCSNCQHACNVHTADGCSHEDANTEVAQNAEQDETTSLLTTTPRTQWVSRQELVSEPTTETYTAWESVPYVQSGYRYNPSYSGGSEYYSETFYRNEPVQRTRTVYVSNYVTKWDLECVREPCFAACPPLP